MKEIVKEPNKVLREAARELDSKEIKTPKIQKLISEMKETLASTPDGVGLAAPQIGESLRIFIVSEEAEAIDRLKLAGKKKTAVVSENDKNQEKKAWKYYVFINPVVKNLSRKKVDGSEGCLSVPGKFGIVRRNEKITVEALDENGKKITRGAANFFARVLQHELDHLEGILFIDKAKILN